MGFNDDNGISIEEMRKKNQKGYMWFDMEFIWNLITYMFVKEYNTVELFQEEYTLGH
jgi:hypothetical protein